MSMKVQLIGDRNEIPAKVTKFGQLVTTPLDYSIAVERDLDVPGVAFNFVEPEAGKSIVITSILVSADKGVSNTEPADVSIYQSDEIDSLIVLDKIIRPQLVRSTNLPLSGLNTIIPPGRWVNGVTDDATITVTLFFYRVPAEGV